MILVKWTDLIKKFLFAVLANVCGRNF